MDPGTNGYIYKTPLYLSIQAHGRVGNRKTVRARRSGRLAQD